MRVLVLISAALVHRGARETLPRVRIQAFPKSLEDKMGDALADSGGVQLAPRAFECLVNVIEIDGVFYTGVRPVGEHPPHFRGRNDAPPDDSVCRAFYKLEEAEGTLLLASASAAHERCAARRVQHACCLSPCRGPTQWTWAPRLAGGAHTLRRAARACSRLTPAR